MTRQVPIAACRATVWLTVLVLLATPAVAQDTAGGGWRLFGTTELRIDDYSVNGDASASPYPFEGTNWLARLGLDLSYDNRSGRTAKVHADLVGADDDYRSEDGFVVERFAAELEDGSTAVPYRLDVGDVFVNFSRRTLQRSIRGVSFELQPGSATGAGQSLVVISGTGEPSWGDTFNGAASNLYFNGTSYLWAAASGASTMSGNLLHVNHRTPPAGGGDSTELETDQLLASACLETRFGAYLLEGEFAYLSGEGDDNQGHDTALFSQLTYSRQPVWWRLRYEDNGEAFRPAGGLGVIADRRFGELQARFKVSGSGQIGVRAQLINDQRDGPRPETETRTVGLSFQGRPMTKRPTFNLRFSWDGNDVEADDHSQDMRFQNFLLEVQDQIGAGYSVTYSANYRDRCDDVSTTGSMEGLDQTVSVGKALRLGSGDGAANLSLRGGVVHRHQWQNNGHTSWSPVVDVSYSREHHRLALHLAFLDQDFAAATSNDLRLHTRRVSYTYSRGRQELTFDIGQLLRRPDGSLKTDSQKASLIYRMRFGQ